MHEELPDWIRYRWQRADAERYVKPAPFDHRSFIAEYRAAAQKKAAAAHSAAAREREERQRRLEILRLKSDIAALRFKRAMVLHMIALQRAAKFNPSQPRVPAGNPDGGQWTSEGGTAVGSGSNGLVAYADAESVSSNTDNPAVQLVASKVTVDYSEALTGISRIDDATKSLIGTLATVVAMLPVGSGPLYGTVVHGLFASAVRAQKLEGIGSSDVETTFSLRDGAHYGSENSVRTDVVLRNEAGEIIAIYDVKTGRRGISQERAAELRAKTETGPGVPIIELNTRRQRAFLKSDRMRLVRHVRDRWV